MVKRKTTDFIGLWIALNESNKIIDVARFDVYVNKERQVNKKKLLKGIIEDPYGKARFSGELDGKKIVLVKKYDKQAIVKGGADSKITYVGCKEGEIFRGNYMIQGYDKKCPFVLEEFDDSYMEDYFYHLWGLYSEITERLK